MNHHWLVNVRCREFQELEPEPRITSRFILSTPKSTEPSMGLVNALISDLGLQHLPGASLTTTDYRIGSLSGEIDKLIARTPDLEKDEIKVWLLKAR